MPEHISQRGDDQEDEAPLRFVGPPACVAPVDNDEANTIVLLPPHLEYLRVRVTFHGVPVPNLPVKLRARDGDVVPSPSKTDSNGIVQASCRVPPGRYQCEVEHQDAVLVSSVPAPYKAYPVVLPVGRPHVDLLERLEFVLGPTSAPGGSR